MAVFSKLVVIVAAAFGTAQAGCGVSAGPELVTGDFSIDARSKAHSFDREGNPFPKARVNPDDYVCLNVNKWSKNCMLPSYATCLLEYSTEGAHCDIMYNGSKDVMVSTKSGNCAVRCYMNFLGQISGDFDISKRSPEQVKDIKARPAGGEYDCITGSTRKNCMLPSGATCFLTYHTEHAHCDILYGNTNDAQLIAKDGNCRARCFDIKHPYAQQALPLVKYEADFDISQRSKPHSGEGFFRAESRNGEEFQCLTAEVRKCMVPSYSTCFLTYITEDAHCDMVYNSSKDAFISAKTGNCSYRCFDLRDAPLAGPAGRRLMGPSDAGSPLSGRRLLESESA